MIDIVQQQQQHSNLLSINVRIQTLIHIICLPKLDKGNYMHNDNLKKVKNN